ncbi:Ger(x)C family spore germination protein [Paenibacillus sp. 1001270B_150601_E10]|uniref:Ger(x)C family spore germination protein n=1 Tax=Paenibacillus sp. 1001270B_150601_E10 TaxID=2787079 RepID=UPI0018A08E7A|nr:Ger(x)C family spore germination protein [Paenibacillus sp. 1001270B_150601_E10]
MKACYRPCLLLLLCCSLILSGCFNSQVILENLSISVAYGFDKKSNDEMLITTVLLSALPQATETSQVITVSAKSSKEARNKMNMEVSRQLVSGQIRSILFDRALAKDGIMNNADTLSRDPSFGDMVYLVVSDDATRDLLHYKYKHFPNIGIYIGEMIEQNLDRGWIMPCTIHDFRKRFYDSGIDPVLPIVERKEELVNLKGSAIFQNDKMVGEVSNIETAYMSMLSNHHNPQTLQFNLIKDGMAKFIKFSEKNTNEIHVDIRNLITLSTIELVSEKDLQFQVKVYLKSELQEISEDYDFLAPGAITTLENEICKQMEKELQTLINKLQKMRSDPIGFGEVYRSSIRHSGLTKEQWHDRFPKAKIQIKTKVNLVRTGTIE